MAEQPTYFSLGCNCSTDYNLRRLGKNVATGPFSWSRIPKISKLITVLKEKINPEKYITSLQITSHSDMHPGLATLFEDAEDTGSYVLKNDYGVSFAHEILDKYELEEFKDKLTTRIERFYSFSTKDNPIRFIRYESAAIKNIGNYLASVKTLVEVLASQFITVNFELVCIVPFKQYDLSFKVGDDKQINVKFLEYDVSQFVDWKQEAVYDRLADFI